jgi:hypothetical protein
MHPQYPPDPPALHPCEHPADATLCWRPSGELLRHRLVDESLVERIGRESRVESRDAISHSVLP